MASTKKTKSTKLPTRTTAEELCEGLAPELRAQAETLANALLTMQEKIEQQIPVYKDQPLAQEVTVGTGETMLRANPVMQEFRATVRDYANTLRELQTILETKKENGRNRSAVEDLRSRFGIG